MITKEKKQIITKEKEEKDDLIKFNELPKELRAKYKNHPLFQKQNLKRKEIVYNEQEQEQLSKIKNKKQKSIRERLKDVKLEQSEQDALDEAFKILCGVDQNGKLLQTSFNAENVARVIFQLSSKLSKQDIELMIWEVDENMDGQIDQQEYYDMYRRSLMEDTYQEPKGLFYLVQFLMFYSYQRMHRSQEDKNIEQHDFMIRVEDTLELIYLRKGRNQLDSEIQTIFGSQAVMKDGCDCKVSFDEFNERVNDRAIQENKEKQLNQKNNIQQMGKIEKTFKKQIK